MKKLTPMKNLLKSRISIAISFTIISLLLGTNLKAQSRAVEKPFTQRTSAYSPGMKIYNLKGDFQMIGNLNLETRGTSNSNSYMQYVDIDGDGTTINSSSADLKFYQSPEVNPACSQVVYAGLYWTGRAHIKESPMRFTVGNKVLNKRKIKLRYSDATTTTTYEEFTANSEDIWYPSEGNKAGDNMYVGYAEVTDFVKEHKQGTYTVADIALMEGNGSSTGYYGGWGMIVVYQNSKMAWRDITIFDGYAYVQGNTTTSYELDVNGFRTAQHGDIRVKLGMIAGEGDRNIEGDYFKIQSNVNNTWYDLKHDGNTTNNFFNSSINVGEGGRNPIYSNNFGLDLAMFNIDNANNQIIGNETTHTKFKYGSTQDTYIISCIVMAVDAYVPEGEALNQISVVSGGTPGGTVDPGEEITYTIEIRNKGTEAIDNFKMNIPIPYSANFVSANATYHKVLNHPVPEQPSYNHSTNSIVWRIGTLPYPPNVSGITENTVLATLTYKIKVTEDCYILSNPNCTPTVAVSGFSSGTGVTSGTNFHNVPMIYGYDDTNGCKEPITTPTPIDINTGDWINTHCKHGAANYDVRDLHFCNPGTPVPFEEVAYYFPIGSRFYDKIDVNTVEPYDDSKEYTIGKGFPNQNEKLYYVIPPGHNTSGCYWKFKLFIENSIRSNKNVTRSLGN